jgi:hypothetical protein
LATKNPAGYFRQLLLKGIAYLVPDGDHAVVKTIIKAIYA